jgi:hypothetical protein
MLSADELPTYGPGESLISLLEATRAQASDMTFVAAWDGDNICSYCPEYGDGDGVRTVLKICSEKTSHPTVVKFSVPLNAEPVKIEDLPKTSALMSVAICVLVSPTGETRMLMYDCEFGDGEGVSGVTSRMEWLVHQKCLQPGEGLRFITRTIPIQRPQQDQSRSTASAA